MEQEVPGATEGRAVAGSRGRRVGGLSVRGASFLLLHWSPFGTHWGPSCHGTRRTPEGPLEEGQAWQGPHSSQNMGDSVASQRQLASERQFLGGHCLGFFLQEELLDCRDHSGTFHALISSNR